MDVELFNSNSPCFNFLQRPQLSRKTRKRATNICRPKDRGNNFLEVGCCAPLPDTINIIVSEGYQFDDCDCAIGRDVGNYHLVGGGLNMLSQKFGYSSYFSIISLLFFFFQSYINGSINL